MAMVKEFKDFLLKQNIVALALAVIVGTALNTLVKALVDDFIMPIVAALGPGGDWQTATWDVGSIKFGVGDFLAALINFLIIGLVDWRCGFSSDREMSVRTVHIVECRSMPRRPAARMHEPARGVERAATSRAERSRLRTGGSRREGLWR